MRSPAISIHNCHNRHHNRHLRHGTTGGSEPDFVLVSCAGKSRPGIDPADLRKVIEAKRRGEENLRTSGLGYSIIRPGGWGMEGMGWALRGRQAAGVM